MCCKTINFRRLSMFHMKYCNLIGLQYFCSRTNPGIGLVPILPFFAWRLGYTRLGCYHINYYYGYRFFNSWLHFWIVKKWYKNYSYLKISAPSCMSTSGNKLIMVLFEGWITTPYCRTELSWSYAAATQAQDQQQQSGYKPGRTFACNLSAGAGLSPRLSARIFLYQVTRELLAAK